MFIGFIHLITKFRITHFMNRTIEVHYFIVFMNFQWFWWVCNTTRCTHNLTAGIIDSINYGSQNPLHHRWTRHQRKCASPQRLSSMVYLQPDNTAKPEYIVLPARSETVELANHAHHDVQKFYLYLKWNEGLESG